MSTREEQDQQVWLYAAGALEGDEADAVRRRIDAGDPADLAVLAAARTSLARLPDALDPVAPPRAVRDRLFARIESSGRSSVGHDRSIGHSTDRSPGATVVARAFPWRAVAAAVALMLSLGYAAKVHRDRSALQDELARTRSDVELRHADLLAIRQTLADERVRSKAQVDALAGQVQALAAQADVLRAPKLQFTSLNAADGKAASGRLFWDQTNNRWHVYVFDLHPPQGRELELWFITPDERKIPAGTFRVDASGNGQITVDVPAGLGPIAVAAITDEPIGVPHPVPTGSVLLAQKLQ